MAEGGCTTCCALLSAAFVLIGCAEPLAISTSESMIVHLHFFTTRRQAQLPDSLTPTAAVTVGCDDAAKERPLRESSSQSELPLHDVQRMRRLART